MRMTWEWIAGFFEGEGYVGWYEPKNGKGRSGKGPRVVIGQKVKEPLIVIRDFLLSEGIDVPELYKRKPPKSGKGRGIWVLQIYKRETARQFLERLSPLLIQKREAARMVLTKIRSLQRKSAVDVSQALVLRDTGLPWYKVAKAMHIHWARLKNTLVAAGIEVNRERTEKEINDDAWRNARNRGDCINCYNPRGKNGTSHLCRKCADKRNAGRRRRRAAAKN